MRLTEKLKSGNYICGIIKGGFVDKLGKIEDLEEQKEKRKFIIELIIVLLIGMLSIGTIITVNIIAGKNRYNDAINNPPDMNWLEEDLEDIFMTKSVDVQLEHIDFEKEELYCVAKANGLYFKVHYVLVNKNFVNWEWKYDRYIQISDVIVSEVCEEFYE